MFNHGDQDFQIHEGDRIAQLILEQIADKPVIQVQELTQTTRGNKGFGSTGSQQINIISGRRGNNKYANNTRDRKEGNDGRGEQDGKGNAYRKLPPQLKGQYNKEDTPIRHAPSPPNADESTSPSPPELGRDRTRSAIANRIAPLPSIAPVSDPEVSPVAPANKAWNSSSESCLAPSLSLSHVRLLKSRKVVPGLDNDDDDEEEMDSKSGRDSGDCTPGTTWTGVEFLCPYLNEATEDITLPPHPAQKAPSSTGAEARTDNEDKTPWENHCKGTQ